jgi:DNA-binding transcriptional LysR family regulator
MDFRELQYILKIAEEKSFSKAAQKLFVAQPSLSQYIQKLEQQLGVKLFDRTTIPLQLTYAGELYVETAKHILDLKEQLSKQIEDIADLKKGRLIIGLSTIRSTYLMPKILPVFYENFPGIEVILVEDMSSELEKKALKGTIDIALMTLPIEETLFNYEYIFTEEILVAIPPQHPLRGKIIDDKLGKHPKINLSELCDEPFILLKQDQKLHHAAINLCKKAGFKPRIILESESIEAANALVTAGMGVTFIPDSLNLLRLASPNPIYASIKDMTPTREVVVAYRKDRYLSKPSQEFINIMKAILGPQNYK